MDARTAWRKVGVRGRPDILTERYAPMGAADAWCRVAQLCREELAP
ncbi:MAG: hypothetical protein ACR2ND_07460 [Solirubrobacteraceae bacterium]